MQSGCVRLVLFRSSLELTCGVAQDVLSAWGGAPDWEFLPPRIDLHALMLALPQPGGPGDGVFFQSAASDDWTGFASPLDDGTHALVRAMCERAPQAETVIAFDDADDATTMVREFELIRKGRSVRLVRLERDGDRWRFVGRGVPLSEEDSSSYSRRHLPERFSAKALRLLLLRLGIDLDAFVTRPIARACLLCSRGTVPRDTDPV